MSCDRGPMTNKRLLVTVLLSAAAVGLAAAAYSVGRSAGEDLVQSAREGSRRGTRDGERTGRTDGFREGRSSGFATTYQVGHDTAYASVVTPTSTTSPPPPPTESLVQKTGARGVQVRVPASWQLSTADGSGSGSTSTWTDPSDAMRKVVVTTGISVGGWYELDGIAGSIDPTLILPTDAQSNALSRTRFSYSVSGSNPALGIWVAELQPDGSPCCYRQAEVATAHVSSDLARSILGSF